MAGTLVHRIELLFTLTLISATYEKPQLRQWNNKFMNYRSCGRIRRPKQTAVADAPSRSRGGAHTPQWRRKRLPALLRVLLMLPTLRLGVQQLRAFQNDMACVLIHY